MPQGVSRASVCGMVVVVEVSLLSPWSTASARIVITTCHSSSRKDVLSLWSKIIPSHQSWAQYSPYLLHFVPRTKIVSSASVMRWDTWYPNNEIVPSPCLSGQLVVNPRILKVTQTQNFILNANGNCPWSGLSFPGENKSEKQISTQHGYSRGSTANTDSLG